MRTSTSTRYPFDKLGIDNAISLFKRSGFDCLDLSIDKFTDEIRRGDWKETAELCRSLAEKHGITYNQAHAPYGGGRGDLNTRGNYATNLVPIMPEALRMAAAAGVSTVVVHPIVFLDTGYVGHEAEHFEANMEYYTKLIPIARDLGIKIAIENLWWRAPVSNAIVNATCADSTEHALYYDTLNAPDVITLCLDVGHSALVGREPEDVIRALGHDRLGALHIHDVDYVSDLHTLPWLSKLNWDAITSSLAEIDYKGELTLEADYFVHNFSADLMEPAVKLMGNTARHLADLVDSKRPKK